jgi:hypothetical protein
VGPGREPGIGDEVIGVDDAQAGPLQQLAFALDSKDTFPPKMEWTVLVGLTYW